MIVRSLSAALLVLALLGCTSAPQTRQMLTAGGDHVASRQIVGVPFFPQTEDQCGPAALASVLNYRGVEADPTQLRQQVYLKQRNGSLQSDLVAASRGHGLLPYKLTPQLDALLLELEAGNPVLVLQNLGFGWLPRWHYAVAIGYDAASTEIILHSGENAGLRRPLGLFEQSWARAEHWALVITSPDAPPASATPPALLSTALALEEVGQRPAAIAAYRTLTQRWPQFVDGWVALANGAYADDDFGAALTAYQQALRLDGSNPLVWNNQAYALRAASCGGQAIASLHCGLRLDPSNPELLSSLDELRHSADLVGPQCPIVLCL